MVCMLPPLLGDGRTVLCRHQGAEELCTEPVSVWTMYQGLYPRASFRSGPRRTQRAGSPDRAPGGPPHPEPGPNWQSKTRTRAHLTLALSTPIPKLMVATITGTFSSIHSFCTSVLSGAFSPRKEGKVTKGTCISLGFPLRSTLGLPLCWAQYTHPESITYQLYDLRPGT